MICVLSRPRCVHPPSGIFLRRDNQITSPGCAPPGMVLSSLRPMGSVSTLSLVQEYWFSGVILTWSIYVLVSDHVRRGSWEAGK